MSLSARSSQKLNDVQSQRSDADLRMLESVQLPELARRNVVEPTAQKDKDLINTYQEHGSTRVLGPEANKVDDLKASASLVFKHPVTNFDFLSVGGGYKSVDVSRMREGDTRTDQAATIKITNMGVGNDGWKYRIEFADNAQYSMRSRLGEKSYAFQSIETKEQLSAQSFAQDIYKKYSDFYLAAGGSDLESHIQALGKLRSHYGSSTNTEVVAVIKSWAQNSKDQQTRSFFERFANSL